MARSWAWTAGASPDRKRQWPPPSWHEQRVRQVFDGLRGRGGRPHGGPGGPMRTRGQFIMDVQTHWVRDITTRKGSSAS